MLIEEKLLKHWIDHFYGYGSWESGIWLIDYEDGGGDIPEEVAEKVEYFSRMHLAATEPTLCDIRGIYKEMIFRVEGPKSEMYKNLYHYRFDHQAHLNGVWKNLIAFIHGFRGERLPDFLEYQRKVFLSPVEEREALIRLYPLPSPHNHAWYYSWLDLPQLGFLKSRAQYERHLFEIRMSAILRNIYRYKPKLVLMYGMNSINSIKESVQASFPSVKFKMVKAVKLHIPQHHITDLNGTQLLITTQIPALRHNRIETGFDWEAFGRSVANS